MKSPRANLDPGFGDVRIDGPRWRIYTTPIATARSRLVTVVTLSLRCRPNTQHAGRGLVRGRGKSSFSAWREPKPGRRGGVRMSATDSTQAINGLIQSRSRSRLNRNRSRSRIASWVRSAHLILDRNGPLYDDIAGVLGGYRFDEHDPALFVGDRVVQRLLRNDAELPGA